MDGSRSGHHVAIRSGAASLESMYPSARFIWARCGCGYLHPIAITDSSDGSFSMSQIASPSPSRSSSRSHHHHHASSASSSHITTPLAKSLQFDGNQSSSSSSKLSKSTPIPHNDILDDSAALEIQRSIKAKDEEISRLRQLLGEAWSKKAAASPAPTPAPAPSTPAPKTPSTLQKKKAAPLSSSASASTSKRRIVRDDEIDEDENENEQELRRLNIHDNDDEEQQADSVDEAEDDDEEAEAIVIPTPKLTKKGALKTTKQKAEKDSPKAEEDASVVSVNSSASLKPIGDVDELIRRNEELTARLLEVQSKYDTVKADADKMQQVQTEFRQLKNLVADMQKIVKEAEDSRDAAIEEANGVKMRADSFGRKFEEVAAVCAKLSAENQSLAQCLSESQAENAQARADASTSSQHESVIQRMQSTLATLSDANSSLSRERDEARLAVERLAAERRAQAQQMSSLQEHIQRLQQSVMNNPATPSISNSYTESLEKKCQHLQFEYSSLRERYTVLEHQQQISRSSSSSSSIMSQEELTSLAHQGVSAAGDEQQLTALYYGKDQSTLVRLNVELSKQILAVKQEKEAAMEEARIRISELEDKIKHLCDEIGNSVESSGLLKMKEMELAQVQGRLDKSIKKQVEAERLAKEAQLQVATLRADCNRMRQEAEAVREKWENEKQRLLHATAEIDRLSSEVERLDRLNKSVSEGRGKDEALLKKNRDDVASQLLRVRGERDAMQKRVRELENENEAVKREAKDLALKLKHHQQQQLPQAAAGSVLTPVGKQSSNNVATTPSSSSSSSGSNPAAAHALANRSFYRHSSASPSSSSGVASPMSMSFSSPPPSLSHHNPSSLSAPAALASPVSRLSLAASASVPPPPPQQQQQESSNGNGIL